MSTVKVLVSGPLTEREVAEINAVAPGAEIRFLPDGTDQWPELETAEIVAGRLSAAEFRRAGRLRWMHTWAAGPDGVLYPEMLASDVVLTSSKGNGAVPLAEHAMMLMLLLNRRAVRWIDAQRERRWDRFTHPELQGQTVGIIGLGHSGEDLALKAKAFHMRVLGMRRTPRPTPNVDELFTPERLHDMLGASDFVVVTAPRTTETEGMLGEPEFRAMRPSAYYICFSRGGIADDRALLRALQEGWIAGAGLDAHGEEPLPRDSPFWTAPNTIITPHNGATTPFTRARGVAIFIENLRRYQEGEPLINVVDKRVGY